MSEVFALRLKRGRRPGARYRRYSSRRVRWRRARVRPRRIGWPARRVIRDVTRLALVFAVSAWARAGPGPVAALGVVLVSRHVLWLLGTVRGSRRLLRCIRPLDRLGRLTTTVALVGCLASVGASAADGTLWGSALGAMSSSGSDVSKAELRAEPGRMVLQVYGPAVLELRTDTEPDERLAMVLSACFGAPTVAHF